MTCDGESLDGYKQRSKWLDLIKKKKSTLDAAYRMNCMEKLRKYLQWSKRYIDDGLRVDDNDKKHYLWGHSIYNKLQPIGQA